MDTCLLKCDSGVMENQNAGRPLSQDMLVPLGCYCCAREREEQSEGGGGGVLFHAARVPKASKLSSKVVITAHADQASQRLQPQDVVVGTMIL